MQAYKRHAAIV